MLHRHKIRLLQGAVLAMFCFAALLFSVLVPPPVTMSVGKAGVLVILFLLPFLLSAFTRATGFARGTEEIAINIAMFFVLVIAASLLEYHLAAMGGALCDETLISADALFGFSWPDVYSWAVAQPLLMRALSFAYYSLEPQIAFVLLALGAIYPQRPSAFISASLVSVMLTLVVFALVPVEGPFAHFGLTTLSQADYTAHYAQMRAHSLALIDLGDLRGVISFPSFHVSSAVVLTYFFRRMSVLSWVIMALNLGMAVGSLVIGGHYLVDIIAGAAVGGITLFLIHDPEADETLQRRLFSHRHD